MIGYKIEARGLDEMITRLKNYPNLVNKYLKRAMTQSIGAVRREIVPLVPVGVSGRLKNSIGSEVIVEGAGSIVGRVGSSLRDEEYPKIMEFGRKPGKMPPPASLERWVHVRLQVPDEEVPGVAYVVARKIGRFGIKGRFFMRTGFEKAKGKIIQYFNHARDAIVTELAGTHGS